MDNIKNKRGFVGPLTLVTLQRPDPILDEEAGVYIIWHDGGTKKVVYVGEVHSRKVRKRLEEHISGSLKRTNKILRHWIRSQGSALKFCFFPCIQGKSEDYEDKLMNLLAPITNKRKRRVKLPHG